MAASVDNASATSNGSPVNDLTHITNTLQDVPAQHPCLNVDMSPHEHHDSTMDGTPVLTEDLRIPEEVFNRLSKQLEAIKSSRASKKSLRAELTTADRRLKQLRKAYHRSRASYDNAVDPTGSLKDAATPAQIASNIAILRETSDRNRQALEAHSSHVRSIQDEIRTTQRALNRSQAEFEAIALQQPSKDESSRTRTDVQTDPTNVSLSRHTPDSSEQGEQPLLDRYLRRAADVGIFGERLAECNYEYWSAVSQREMLLDRDETLSVSDEDFEQHWQIEKKIITQDLDSAIQDADALLAACQKEGLVVESDGNDQWNVDTIQPDVADGRDERDRLHSLETTVSKMPHALFDDAEVVRADPSDDESVLQEKPKIVDRVGTWMESVQADEVGMV
jgi:hypothetical protein